MTEESLEVKSITTIELNKEVVSLCKQKFDIIYGNILYGNFYEMALGPEYDTIIGDIWEDIIPESLSRYIKFKEKARQLLKHKGQILAWGKEYFEYLIKEKQNNETSL